MMADSDQDLVWETYKTAWRAGKQREMSPESFSALFTYEKRSREAVELARTYSVAHEMLKKASLGASTGDSDVRRLWFFVNGGLLSGDFFAEHRGQITPGERKQFISDTIRYLMNQKGRGFVRSNFRRWWEQQLIEEEREALIEAAFLGGIRDLAFYRALGPNAFNIASMEAWKYGPSNDWSRNQNSALPSVPGLPGLASRFDVLLEPVELATDLKDACLTPSELSQLRTWSTLMGPPQSAIRRGLKRIFDHPGHEELLFALERRSLSEARGANWSFPVIRFLHLQQILEAPQLARVARDPALVLVPEVALFAMGRDAIAYQPELRVLRGSDRRWRARWAETAGEAASVMFLEDSVGLDLGTLSRVPERNDRVTPDFMAGSVHGQKIVFESKGATHWPTHLKQRKHALAQLGKDRQASDISWGSEGRTFACSLFAAEQGEEKTSLLHIDDPPFQFEGDFGEGWEIQARRNHAVAMLEAARLYELADHLSRRGRGEQEFRDFSIFSLPGEIQTEASFVGTYLPIAEWARALRHPSPRECARLQIFVGIEKGIYRNFEHERFLNYSESSENSAPELPSVLGSGILPGPKGARGVYSVLSDGAFLAVFVD